MLKALEAYPAEDPMESSAQATEVDPSAPLLVVVDSKCRVQRWESLKRAPYWRNQIVLTSSAATPEALKQLEQQGIDYIKTGSDKVDLRKALHELNERYGVAVVVTDSGGTLNGVLLRQGLVREISLLYHPCLVGGNSPQSESFALWQI